MTSDQHPTKSRQLVIREEILAIRKLNDVSMTPCHHYQVKLEYRIKALYSDRRMNESI